MEPERQVSPHTVQAVVDQISRTLRETNLALVKRVVETLGPERTLQFLDRTLETEARGGLMTNNGRRRRTPGGVFFYLIRGSVTDEERKAIFPRRDAAKGKRKRKPIPPFPWDKREAAFRLTRPHERGVAKVEIKLVGKPLKVIERKNITIVTLRSGNPPTLPKGLPVPPDVPTVFLVFIGAKQWRKVKPYMEYEDDRLIIRGWPIFDKKLGAITVLAQSTTSTIMERERAETAEE